MLIKLPILMSEAPQHDDGKEQLRNLGLLRPQDEEDDSPKYWDEGFLNDQYIVFVIPYKYSAIEKKKTIEEVGSVIVLGGRGAEEELSIVTSLSPAELYAHIEAHYQEFEFELVDEPTESEEETPAKESD